MKIAFVTGGGDSAGINSAISGSIVNGMIKYGDSFIGIKNAFAGLASGSIEDFILPMDHSIANAMFDSPSTLLGSSRFSPFSPENSSWAPVKIKENCSRLGIDAIIATGGNDTIFTALKVHELGIPIIAIPKSIDNDISGTDWMLGVNTAIDFAVKAFKSTAVSADTHSRININEIMGRQAGWLAYYSGIASGADIILVPERNFKLMDFIEHVKKLQEKKESINIVVSEGIHFDMEDPVIHRHLEYAENDPLLDALLNEKPEIDPHGNVKLGGAGIIIQRILASALECSLSYIRHSNIGFSLRGLQPNAFDINLGQRFGRKAIELLHKNKSGLMVGIQGTRIVPVPIEKALPQYTLDSIENDELSDFGVFMSSKNSEECMNNVS